jgi:hypothetical protein
VPDAAEIDADLRLRAARARLARRRLELETELAVARQERAAYIAYARHADYRVRLLGVDLDKLDHEEAKL